MEFNNTCSVYEKSSADCMYIIALYVTIGFLTKYYRDYFKYINFEYDSNDEYSGIICI